MRTKLEGHAYCSIADLEKDFDLMISNCLKYNSKDTLFHRAAVQLRDVGGAILRHAQRQSQTIGLDPSNGMHLPDSPNKHGFYQCTWDDGEWVGRVPGSDVSFPRFLSMFSLYNLQSIRS